MMWTGWNYRSVQDSEVWSCFELLDVYDTYLAAWSLAVLRDARCTFTKVLNQEMWL